MLKKINKTTETIAAFAATTYSTGVDLNSNLGGAKGWSCIASVTSAAATAHDFATTDVNTTTDIITSTAHGYVTGRKVQFTTTTTLPAGLSLLTDYFIIATSLNGFAVATTLVLAQAGTKVNITDQGTGTHTVTPVALAGATCKVQLSIDNVIYVDKASSSQNITASTDLFTSDVDVMYQYARLAFTLTAGQISASVVTLQKG